MNKSRTSVNENIKGEIMYTHIGNGEIVKNKNVIGVFDISTLQMSKTNYRLINDIDKVENKDNAQKKKSIEDMEFKSKAVILLDSDEMGSKYILSDIAVSTLKKRFETYKY